MHGAEPAVGVQRDAGRVPATGSVHTAAGVRGRAGQRLTNALAVTLFLRNLGLAPPADAPDDGNRADEL